MPSQAAQSMADSTMETKRTDASIIDFMPFANKSWMQWGNLPEQLEKAGFPAASNFEAIKAMNKEAVEAVVKSTSVLANGVEEISRHALAMAHDSVKSNLEAIKAIAEAQTPQDWANLQSNWAGHYATLFFNQAAELSGLSVKVSQQTAEPIQDHINGAFSKIRKRD